MAIPGFPAGLVSRNRFAPSYLGLVVLVQTAFIEGVSQCQGLRMSVALAAGVAINGAECAAEDTALSPELYSKIYQSSSISPLAFKICEEK